MTRAVSIATFAAKRLTDHKSLGARPHAKGLASLK